MTIKYRISWASPEDDGCFSCEADSIKEALVKSIQAGISSLDWQSIWELKPDGWQKVEDL